MKPTKDHMTTTKTPVAPVPAVPFSINVGAPAHAAFAEAVQHARNGYCFSDGPIELTPNGFAFFTMIRGNPNEFAIQAAKESVERSVLEEERQYRKDVEQAAKAIIEQQQRDALAKQVAAAVAEHEKAIAKLKQQTEAEVAQLNAAAAAELARLK
jgi:hypothetical protein